MVFASWTPRPAEENYAQLHHKEPAVVFIAQNYHKLIPGRKVSFCTDHHLLLGVLGSSKPIAQSLPPHTSRWCGCASLYLYYNILRYRAGKTHQSVDALSRLTFSEGFEEHSLPRYVS